MAKVSAIVLAAGLSRRMGSVNKMGLLFQGKPLVHHVIDQLQESNAFKTIIVTSRLSQALFPDHEVVLNEHFESGMTSSIKAGVRAADEDADGYMICLGDQPLIRIVDYNRIIRIFEENLVNDPQSIVLPIFEGKKGNPVIFSAHYKKDILSHKAPKGCRGIVEANQDHIVFQEMETAAILYDVDSQEDYQNLTKRDS